jgi:hypothetical protein
MPFGINTDGEIINCPAIMIRERCIGIITPADIAECFKIVCQSFPDDATPWLGDIATLGVFTELL